MVGCYVFAVELGGDVDCYFIFGRVMCLMR